MPSASSSRDINFEAVSRTIVIVSSVQRGVGWVYLDLFFEGVLKSRHTMTIFLVYLLRHVQLLELPVKRSR
jgi:hypothetical protein